MDVTKLMANLAKITYEPMEKRNEEAQKFGFRVVEQDRDRVLYANDEGRAVIGLRGTDIKNPKNAVRDILTDIAIFFGKEGNTPRFETNRRFAERAIGSGKFKSIESVGHSLGAVGSADLGKRYGIKSYGFNPAFMIPQVAQSIKDRIRTFGKKQSNIIIHSTYADPISFGVGASSGKVFRHKTKADNAHSIRNFI